MRKRTYGPRPSRSKGTDAWLAQQLDKDGFQHELLMFAFRLYEDPAARLRICVERRATFNGVCNYDGRVSLVRFRGRYLAFVRANTKRDGGGRHVQVAMTSRDEPRGTP